MNGIDAFEAGIDLQRDLLRTFKPHGMIPRDRLHSTIFVGCGDSLASAMLAESFSGYMSRAMDPLDLMACGDLLDQNEIRIISVSGRTRANVELAGLAGRSVAITGDPASRLARAAGRTIELSAPASGVPTAGSVSFLESSLACISMVDNAHIPRDADLLIQARDDAAGHSVSRRIHILGNRRTYPVAMYCAAKFYEVLGWDARHSRMEQFSHMGLFSARGGDTILILDGTNEYSTRLASLLDDAGMNVIHPPVPEDDMPQVLYCTFISQYLALHAARRESLEECHFVTSGTLLDTSNRMIY